MKDVVRYIGFAACLLASPAAAVSVFSAGAGGFISVVDITGGPSSVSFSVDAPVEVSDTATSGASGANATTNLDILIDPAAPVAVAVFDVSTDGFAVAAPDSASASGYAFGLLSGSVTNLTASAVTIDFTTTYSIFAFTFVDNPSLESAFGFASISVDSAVGGVSSTLFTQSIVASSLLDVPVSGEFLVDQVGDFSLVLAPGETSFLTATFYAAGEASAAPIPLPATAWLLFSGIGVLVGVRRRRSVPAA